MNPSCSISAGSNRLRPSNIMGWVRDLRALSRSSFLNSSHSVAMTSASQPSATAFMSSTNVASLSTALAFSIALGSCTQKGAFLSQAKTQLDSGGGADVIRVLLEGEAQHADGLVLEHPEGIQDLLHEPVHLHRIDVLDLL